MGNDKNIFLQVAGTFRNKCLSRFIFFVLINFISVQNIKVYTLVVWYAFIHIKMEKTTNTRIHPI